MAQWLTDMRQESEEQKSECFSCKLWKGTKDMLSDGRFWVGVIIGAGGFYAYTRYKAKKS